MLNAFTPSGAPPISYLFVDGESLNRTLIRLGDRFFRGEKPSIDWSRLRGSHRKVFYYDAVPVQHDGEDENSYSQRVAPKREELKTIEHQSGFHVRSGEVRHRKRRGNEQKMVDVHLAVDAMLMASRGLFSSMSLITGDLDFRPLVSALVEMGIDVQLIYPFGETSDELMASADRADPMKINFVSNWLLAKPDAKSNLPIAYYDFKSDDWPSQSIIEWGDLAHGKCSIALQGDGGLILLTETSPDDTHRLRVTADDATVLRAYVKDVFGMDVPEQSSET